MPKYTLHYFDARGRAEVSRLMFASKGVEFEDHRITMEEWEKFKPNAPFGLLPVLEVEGKKFAQSQAVTGYVAREMGYHGETNLETLAIEQVTTLLYDFIEKGKVAYAAKDEETKNAQVKEYTDTVVPKYLGFFEQMLTTTGTGHLVGSRLTLADFVIFDFLGEAQRLFSGCTEKFPKLQKLQETVGSLPKIKAYIEKRKPTPF